MAVSIGVQDFDIDTSVGHSAHKVAELSSYGLIESRDDHISFGQYLYVCGEKRTTGTGYVLNKEMSHATSVNNEHAATFNAHTCSVKSVGHFREGTRTVH